MYRIMLMKQRAEAAVKGFARKRSRGDSTLLVEVSVCIIAILLCVIMKDSMKTFIETLGG